MGIALLQYFAMTDFINNNDENNVIGMSIL